MNLEHIVALQERVEELVHGAAYASAETLARGLLIETPVTRAVTSSRELPAVGPGSATRTLRLLGDALRLDRQFSRAGCVYRDAILLLAPGDSPDEDRRREGTAVPALAVGKEAQSVLCELRYSLCECQEQDGDLKAAFNHLSRVPEPLRSPKIYLKLGHLAHRLDDRSTAKRAFMKAWRASPFMLEAAKSLVEIGVTATELLQGRGDSYAQTAPWIPILINAYYFERTFRPEEALQALAALGPAFDSHVEVLIQKARIFMLLNDLEEASQYFRRAHQKDERRVDSMDLYAFCLHERRDIAQLNRLAHSLMNTAGPNRPEGWIAAAFYSLQRNDDKAASLADQAVRAGPRHSLAYFVKGLTLLIPSQQLSNAVKWFRIAHELWPSIKTFEGMISASLAAGQVKNALLGAREARQLMPDNPKVYVLMGTVYSRGDLSEHQEKARRAFRKALSIDPRCEDAITHLVDLHLSADESTAAITLLTAALEHHQTARFHSKLGDAYTKGGDFDEAINHFQQALAIDTHYLPAQEGLEKAEKLVRGVDPDESLAEAQSPGAADVSY